jgi:hypothetical protein
VKTVGVVVAVVGLVLVPASGSVLPWGFSRSPWEAPWGLLALNRATPCSVVPYPVYLLDALPERAFVPTWDLARPRNNEIAPPRNV